MAFMCGHMFTQVVLSFTSSKEKHHVQSLTSHSRGQPCHRRRPEEFFSAPLASGSAYGGYDPQKRTGNPGMALRKQAPTHPFRFQFRNA